MADEHEMPSSSLSFAPLGFGLAWIAHSVAFQCSTKVTYVPELFLSSPTAVHAVAVEHDASMRTFSVAPLGYVVVCMDHSAPFQRMANGTRMAPEPFLYAPTAVQAVDDEHDTPSTKISVSPSGLGVDSIDHSVPFQRSAKVTRSPELP